MPYPPLNLSSPMPFGKHKGKTVAELLDDAPDYLLWCYHDLGTNFSEEVREHLKNHELGIREESAE